MNLAEEFDRQVDTLLRKEYPVHAGLSTGAFLERLMPLKDRLQGLSPPEIDLEGGRLPFVLVIKSESVPSEAAMSLVERRGKNGVTILRPHTTEDFKTIDSVSVPKGAAYLLIDIDRGNASINLPPNEAMQLIRQADRSPLTIDEGIAIVTHFPDFLRKNHCYSLLASRTGTDQRVPAIWINGSKEPNLGWCWDGNPHTWLGSASCGARAG